MSEEERKREESPIFTLDDANWIDADYQVTSREEQKIQNYILKVNRQIAVAQKRIPTKKVPRGIKKYTIETISEVTEPKFTDDFLKEDQQPIVKSETDFYLAFMHHDYRVRMTDQDAVANSQFHSEPLAKQTIGALTASIGDYREKVIWRGYDIAGRANAAAANQGVIDTNVKGILNTSGINTFHAGDGDAVITTVGDMNIGAGNAVVSLIADDYYGPYDSYMTPGVWGRSMQNQNATTGLSDMKLIKENMIDVNGNQLFKSFNVTKHLLPTVEASATEANWVIIDPKDPQGHPTVVILESYPITNYTNSQRAAIASSGKIVWSGCAAVLRTGAITWDENITFT